MLIEHTAIIAIIASAVAFVTVWGVTPPLIRYLTKIGSVVLDYHKPKKTMVARPGGISIIAGIVAGETALYVLAPSNAVLAILATSVLAFVVGYIDDKRVMGGWFKPIWLAVASAPIIIFGAYDTHFAFPIFGEVQIPLLYFAIIPLMISITGNTINTIDVFNGLVSFFMVIAGSVLTISLVIMENYEIAAACLPLVAVSLAFYKFHKNPSRIFPGDSGALALGGMYGAIALVGNIEIVAVVALLPAVINSFFFLSSVKRIVEHKEIKIKPVELVEDCKMRVNPDPNTPLSLVGIILSGGSPQSDKQVRTVIFRLTIFSGVLAIITAILMSVRI